jgi:acyl-CoA hydrolase
MSQQLIRRPEDTRVEMTQLVLPSHTNNHGTAFGGQIAAWVDICAAVSAQRFCRMPVVTASMDALHFLNPVQKGMVVILKSTVNCAWNTSMEIGVRIESEHPLTGERQHCCSAYLTFVAIDKNGQKQQLPNLVCDENKEWERRRNEAQERRDMRLKIREIRKMGGVLNIESMIK